MEICPYKLLIANQVKFENADKGLCIICGKPVKGVNITCSKNHHEEFVKFCETKFGPVKKVVDDTTGIVYAVPTRDIIEQGLSWENLPNYPQWHPMDAVDVSRR